MKIKTQPDYTIYSDGYQVCLPMDLQILIPADDPVRLLGAILEELNYEKLMATYSTIGRLEYSPKNLFKILVYGYTRKIYSTRELERACRENVNFMYLLEGSAAPDHNTIARFRTEHLGNGVAEDLLTQFVELLIENDEISFEESAVFIDGTKIEANANKYGFVWRKAVVKSIDKLVKRIHEELPKILEEIGVRMYVPEDADMRYLKKVRKQLYAKKKQERIEFVHGIGKRKSKVQRACEKVDEWLDHYKRYVNSVHICGDRNSYSKTDKDATFMHMKEDHMLNGQLKPGYNINVATVSEYIIGNYVSSDRTDTKTLIPFLNSLREKYPIHKVVADSGYESEENYKYFDGSEQLSFFVKPSNHEQKKSKKYRTDISRRENMKYDSDDDFFSCANGRKIIPVAERKVKTTNGFNTVTTIYECESCEGCPYKEKCITGRSKESLENRVKRLQFSKYFESKRKEMEKKISTSEGIKLRINRSIQAEGVFSFIKEDMQFRRFLTRGFGKVKTEWTLLSIAYDILKLHFKIQNGVLGRHLIEPECINHII